MVDRRLGRADGPQPMQGVRRRPEFVDGDGVVSTADNASDAARASGRVRGDLRGAPARNSPEPTYASTRAPVRRGAQRGADAQEDDQRIAAREESGGARRDRHTARDERQYDDRNFSEDRDLTDDERVAMVRQGYFQVALPDLPRKPGLHRMWLTTTNPRDPIAARQRMGYRLLKVEDLGPGWDQQKALTGEYAGCVQINEMVAAEINETLYQRYMRELHHNMPRETERGIYGQLEAHNDALARKGSRLIMDSGSEENAFATLGAHVPAPDRFE